MLILLTVALTMGSASAQQSSDEVAPGRWAIALHGGAGKRSREMTREARESLERSLEEALKTGREMLSTGGSALDAVEAVVVVLEDDPQFNAGKGAVFTRSGEHELDASIMDGATLRGGAVAGVKFQKNPVKAARRYRNFKRPFLARGIVLIDLWVVNFASRRSRIGDFPGHASARGARIRGVLASRASAGQRGLSAQGVEPDGRGYRLGVRVRRLAA
jgi:hypothetical protein